MRIRVTVDNYKCDEMLPHSLDYDWSDDGGLTRNALLTVFDSSDLFDMQVTYSIKNMTSAIEQYRKCACLFYYSHIISKAVFGLKDNSISPLFTAVSLTNSFPFSVIR